MTQGFIPAEKYQSQFPGLQMLVVLGFKPLNQAETRKCQHSFAQLSAVITRKAALSDLDKDRSTYPSDRAVEIPGWYGRPALSATNLPGKWTYYHLCSPAHHVD